MDFDANLGPCWLSKSTKIRKRSVPRGIKKLIDFRVDNFGHVGSISVPKFRQLGRHWRHLGPQDPPTWPPRGLKKLGAHEQISSFFRKWPPRPPKTDFGPNFHQIFIVFGRIVDQILIGLGLNCGSILDQIWTRIGQDSDDILDKI